MKLHENLCSATDHRDCTRAVRKPNIGDYETENDALNALQKTKDDKVIVYSKNNSVNMYIFDRICPLYRCYLE